MSASETQDTAPTVSLKDLLSDDAERRRSAGKALMTGFGEYGLVFVSDSGFDQDRLDRLYGSFLEFTRRSAAEKQELARADLWYQRGWTPPNTEVATASTGQPDYKECFFAACLEADREALRLFPELYAENVWPGELPTIQEDYAGVARDLQEVGAALLAACEEQLEIERGSLVEGVDGGPHVTRLLRYLPVTAEALDRGVLWGENHTDFNALTLLPGGRFLDPDGEFCAPPDDGESGLFLTLRETAEHPYERRIRGRAPKGCVIAQIGQQLEVLTGGTLLATPHEIEAPRTPGYSRLSCAHFIHMNPREILFPYSRFQSDRAVEMYKPPVLAGTYDLKTLVDIGLAPASALDRLGYGNGERLKK